MRGKIDIPELIPVLEQAGVEKIEYCHFFRQQTECVFYTPHGKNQLVIGRAHLNPLDQFCRRTGRIIALRRAVHALDLKHRRNGK
jgi:hypothetical protein